MTQRQTVGSHPAKLLIVIITSLALWLMLWALTSWMLR